MRLEIVGRPHVLAVEGTVIIEHKPRPGREVALEALRQDIDPGGHLRGWNLRTGHHIRHQKHARTCRLLSRQLRSRKEHRRNSRCNDKDGALAGWFRRHGFTPGL